MNEHEQNFFLRPNRLKVCAHLRDLREIFLLHLFILPVLLPAQTNFQTCATQFNSKQYDSALACLKQLQQDSPTKENLFDRGLCYYQLKNYPRAIAQFDTCLAIDSAFKEAWWMLASACEQNGNYKKAQTIYRMLNTKYGGYKDSQKRVLYYHLSVIISTKWYYMLAIIFLVIIFVTLVAKSVTYWRG